MDDVQVGSLIRSVRIRRGLRQIDVAGTAGVSQAIVSAIEHGDFERSSLRIVRSVATAVGVSLPLQPRWRGAELPKLLDERHAAVVRAVVARLTALDWEARPEHTFSIYGERGSVDVLAWLPASRAVLVVEVKTVLVDLQDLLSVLDRKRRLALSIAREAGWKPLTVGTLLVMPAETQARSAVDKYRPLFDASYPARGTQVQRWLRTPQRDLAGVWFLNFTPGDAKRRDGGLLRVRPKRHPAGGNDPRSDGAAQEKSAACGPASAGEEPALHRRG
jgi:transcriptional regulator with XRE-family HTH domain